MITKDNRLTAILLIVAALLLVPFISMQFSNTFNWSGFDFLIAGVLLLGAGLICEFIMRKVTRISHRVILCGVALLVFFIIWAELAVGLFGTPFAGS